MLKQTNTTLYKYFKWEGTISPNIKDLTGNDVDAGYFLMLNNKTDNKYLIHNILKVEVDGEIKNLSTNIQLGEDDKEYLPSPGTVDITSENGIFDGKKIQRGFRGERFEKKYDSFVLPVFYQKNKDTKK